MTERKKRICFFSGDITRGGGTERVAVLIAGHLAARESYEVIFLSIVEQRKEMFFKPVRKIPRHVLSRSGKWIAMEIFRIKVAKPEYVPSCRFP